MKRLFILVVLVCLGTTVYSQDVITLKDGSTIQAKVLKIDETQMLIPNVTYRLWEESDGPERTIPFKLVTSIKYESGRTDLYPSAVFVDGDDLHDAATNNQIPDDLLKLILTPEEYISFSKASTEYNDARKSRAIGKWHIIPGAIMLGLGSLLSVSSANSSNYNNSKAQKGDIFGGLAIAAGGSALLTIGIIRVAGKGKKMDQAEAQMNTIADQYNERNDIKASSYSPTINLGATRNGLGLTLNF